MIRRAHFGRIVGGKRGPLGVGIDDDLCRIESDSAQRILRTMRVAGPAQAAA
jgi:hypothetical protein